jgi:alpha-ketoglutarate-dependent taurine dioxygenase
MAITVTRLTPCFAARVDGADITRPLDDATWTAIRTAFEEHSVLLFRGQPLDDETQIAFSKKLGTLELAGADKAAAEAALKAACEKLLANTVIENYRVEIGA